ncbi:uncharacterized protein LOC112053534 [Bicyclus anynana]|uniref:Uncharacterized protein LOC112053534 n=1 Tax=Bicyclus anynana TaxID=110368 RepID=A0A6J1NLW3_BICAN|nr:uncharacterized protein LOC112053534 [Bicyclus anynana]
MQRTPREPTNGEQQIKASKTPTSGAIVVYTPPKPPTQITPVPPTQITPVSPTQITPVSPLPTVLLQPPPQFRSSYQQSPSSAHQYQGARPPMQQRQMAQQQIPPSAPPPIQRVMPQQRLYSAPCTRYPSSNQMPQYSPINPFTSSSSGSQSSQVTEYVTRSRYEQYPHAQSQGIQRMSQQSSVVQYEDDDDNDYNDYEPSNRSQHLRYPHSMLRPDVAIPTQPAPPRRERALAYPTQGDVYLSQQSTSSLYTMWPLPPPLPPPPLPLPTFSMRQIPNEYQQEHGPNRNNRMPNAVLRLYLIDRS